MKPCLFIRLVCAAALATLALSACQPASPSGLETPAVEATPTRTPASTPAPPWPTADSSSPTPAEPTPERASSSISAENVAQLVIKNRLGQGSILGQPVFSPDGAWTALPVSTGLHLYGQSGPPRVLASGLAVRADFSSDGKKLAVGNPNGRVTIWEIESGLLLHELVPPSSENFLTELTFAPSGEDLLVGYGPTNEVHLGDGITQEVVYIVSGMNAVFAPTGETLLTDRWADDIAQGKIFELYDHASGALLHRWNGSHARYTPTGQVAVERDSMVRIMDPGTGKTLQSFPASLIDFSADGTLIAAAKGRVVELYDAATARLLRTMDGVYSGADELRFSPDGETLAGSMRYCETPNCAFPNQMTVVWRTADGARLAVVQDPSWLPWFVFHPDSQTLVTAGALGFQIRSTADGTVQREVGGYSPSVSGLAVSPNGRWLSAAECDTAWLWDTNTGLQLGKYTASSGCGSDISTAISPNGEFLTLGGALFRVSSGELVLNLEQRLDVSFAVSQVAFAPDGRRVAVGFTSGELFLWNIAEDRIERKLDGEGGQVTSLAFSEDSQTLVSVSSIPDFQVQFWRVKDGQRVQVLEKSLFHKVALSQNGQTLAALIAQDELDVFGLPEGEIQLWDMTSGSLLPPLNTHNALSLALSPDGSLAATGAADGRLRLWNVSDGTLAAELAGHTTGITALAFTQDGMRLITASLDGSTLIWGLP
jgi:WD40 repeat protein